MGKPFKQGIIRFIPLFILLGGVISFIYFGGYEYLSFQALKQYHQALLDWKTQHYLVAPFLFILAYMVLVAFSVPEAAILSIVGGYVFGIIEGTFYTVIGATGGACILFLSVKSALGPWLSQKAKPWVKRFKNGFQKNAFHYLLVLRLIPLFPFWVINIVPALIGVRFKTYLAATFIGIIPGTFVYVSLGSGLDNILRTHHSLNLKIIFEPRILLPILALALLAIIPIIYKKVRGG